jgi:hypothetical protein
VEIVGFVLASLIAFGVALLSARRLPIIWRRPRRRGKGEDPGFSER